MQPLISVIVPIYKVEKYLKECVDSILNQTYKNLEIILVDDGSPDNCGKICDEYKQIDNRVVVIHKKNGGLSSARNAGIEIAKGEYLSFIDSDDYVSPYFIEIMFKGILFNDADIVTCTGSIEFPADSVKRPRLVQNANDCTIAEIDKDDAIKKLSYQNIPNGVPFRIYKKSIFNNIRFPEGYIFEDVATTYRTFLLAKKMAVVNADIYAYRVRKNSIVRMKFSKAKMVVIPITKKMFKDICKYDKKYKNAAASRAFAQNYHVFLQIPFSDRKDLKLVWSEMKKYRKIVLNDNSPMIRKKNKIGARVSYLGMNISYLFGKLYLRLR